ncbi:MAG: hypothetical protein ISR77_40365 [Pirellulaceae bacterium]|nr:hypothetical protein [Pirellulaceae bacterium]
MIRNRWLLAFVLLMLAGCGNPAAKMQSQETPNWPALDALQQDAIIGIGMGMDMGGPKEAQRATSTPAFKKVVDDFANAPIPSKFATSEREAAKTQLVENLRKFSQGGSDDELKALWEQIGANVKTLTTP